MSAEIKAEKPVMAWLGKTPVYADEIRELADVATEARPETWKPANVAAQKLFRCVECLRDIEELLQSARRSKTKVKQRRKLKMMLTPLHSLVEGVRDLSNDLENNPDTISRLPAGGRALIPKIRSQLLQLAAIGKGSLLSAARNKISAHIDESLSEHEMRILLSQAEPSQIGLWLHTCVSVLSDFIKLPVYFWSCQPDGEGSLRILFVEPFVVTLRLDASGRANRLMEIHMIPSPPRHDILQLLMRIVKSSKWMFAPGHPHIRGFVLDEPTESWARSLECLPKLSGSPVTKSQPSFAPAVSSYNGEYQLVPANVPFFVKECVQRITKLDDLIRSE